MRKNLKREKIIKKTPQFFLNYIHICRKYKHIEKERESERGIERERKREIRREKEREMEREGERERERERELISSLTRHILPT